MIDVARLAEELGYASLWSFQRVLQPVADTTPAYAAVHDAVLPLAHVASHTRSIGLGTATVCAPFTPPALLAKAMATLDHLTAGRLTVGVGMGWLPEEYEAAGLPYAGRGARFEEYLRCLVALWTEDPVEVRGEHYSVPRSHLGIRPVQRPHPPVLVGGAAPAALRRAGRLAQGWIASTRQDPDSLADAVALVRAGAREAGRDPGAVRVLVRAVVDLVGADPGPGRRPFHGTREQVLEDLAAVRRHGAGEVLVDLNFLPRVGSPEVDADVAVAEAEHVLHALAPARRGS